jgi:hypothetical protein
METTTLSGPEVDSGLGVSFMLWIDWEDFILTRDTAEMLSAAENSNSKIYAIEILKRSLKISAIGRFSCFDLLIRSTVFSSFYIKS